MWWLGMVAGLVALLSVPVELRFQLSIDTGVRVRVTASWMFGLVRIPLRGGPSKSKPRKPSSRLSGGRGLRVLRDPRFRRKLTALVWKLIRALRPREFYLRLRLGFDDPADTGLLWAVAGPLSAMAPTTAVDMAPDFTRETLETEARGCVRIIPAQVAGLGLAFFLSPAAAYALWNANRGERTP